MNGQVKKDSIVQRLKELEDGSGNLTPNIVLEDARAEDSPLHGEFEWDDSVAAEKYRLDQARELVRIYVSTVTETHVIVHPAYIRDPDAEVRAQGYTSVAHLRTDKQRALAALQNEIARAVAYVERVHNLAIALGLAEEAEIVMTHIHALRDRVELMAA